jgi:conjugative transposon TraN protein
LYAERTNERTLKACCEKLANEKRRIYYLNDRRNKMALRLKGIYTREEAVFLQISLRNYSNIDYTVDKIGLYVTDPKKNGKGESGQTEILPLYVYGNIRLIRGKAQELCVFALPRFTLPRGKILVIDVSEKNGGRHLQLRTDNYTLLNARLI